MMAGSHWTCSTQTYMFAAVEWLKVLSRFVVVGLLCCLLVFQHVFNNTGFYKVADDWLCMVLINAAGRA